MKTGDPIWAVRRVSKSLCVVDDGTVICGDAANLSWHDTSGLVTTSPAGDCFPTRAEAEAHKDRVLERPYP